MRASLLSLAVAVIMVGCGSSKSNENAASGGSGGGAGISNGGAVASAGSGGVVGGHGGVGGSVASGGSGTGGTAGLGPGDPNALPVLTEPFGFATQYQDPVTGALFLPTGGSDAPLTNVYVVTNRRELRAALSNSASPTYATDATAALLEPKLIYVVGTLHGDELDQGGFADAAYYKTTPNPNVYDFDTYLKYFDDAYKATLADRAATGDTAAADELALINQQPGSARTTFSNNQKSQIQFQVPPNTSLLGAGTDAKIVDGYLSLNTYSATFGRTLRSNVIIRNIEFQVPQDLAPAWDPTDTSTGAWNARYDGISVVTGRAIWIDHCTFSDGAHEDSAEPAPFNGKHVQRHDGLIDIEDGSDAITLSYDVFRRHDKTTLIGSTGGGTTGQENYETGKERITFFGNLWEDSTQRDPLARWGHFHLANNVYRGNTTDPGYPLHYFIGAGTSSSILSEANVFQPSGDSPTSLERRVVNNSRGSEFHDAASWFLGLAFDLDALAPGTHVLSWSPPYDIPLGAKPEDVNAYVEANAGSGKLDITAP